MGRPLPPGRLPSPAESWSAAAAAVEAASGAPTPEAGWVAALDVLGPLDRLTAVQVAAALAVLVSLDPDGLGMARRMAERTVLEEWWADSG